MNAELKVGLFADRVPPANDPNYQSSSIRYLQRTLLKVVEIWRSFASSIQNLFRCSTNRIENGELLGSFDILNNINDAGNLAYLDEQVINQSKITESNLINSNKPIVFLPLTIKDRVRNHIVFFAINNKTKEIIFYDSKGWSLSDYGLQDTYQLIRQKYPAYKFVQNTKKEQYDTFNCGIYVIKRILKLNENPSLSFDMLLTQDPLSYDDVMKARRDGSIVFKSQ